MQSRKATLADVARHAGVSTNTASVVLNGARSSTRVSEDTRRRVQASAAALQYHPNAVARGLARQRTQTLGALFALDSTRALADPYAANILQGLTIRAGQDGYDVLLYTHPWHDAARSAPHFRDGRSDGLVLIAPPVDSDILSGLAALRMPLVAIAATPEQMPEGVPLVDVDNPPGIRLAVAHLAGLGHRRIAHITGDENVGSARQRREAFVDAMDAHGLTILPGYIVAAHYSSRGGEEAFAALLDLPQPPTAIIAGNDNIAFAVLQAARQRGVDIPSKLSLVGFDDAPLASRVTPSLTTLRQPLQEIGATAVGLLTALLNVKTAAPGETISLLAPELIVRNTTAPPPDR